MLRNVIRVFGLLALGLLSVNSAWSQTLTITGHVYSGPTQQPLPFASVFLASTTKGTLTDSTGQFTLANVPAGQFDLIVSFVGFATLKTTIQTHHPKAYRFILKPSGEQLESVTVKARRRRQDFTKEIALFTDNFLGLTQNAKQCRLLNANVLRFTQTDSSLTATAGQPLVIENQALGYRLTYQLEQFNYNYGQQRIAYQGYPLFEELTPKNSQQAADWKEKRQQAYRGSLMHFARALYRKCLVDEGFVIQQLVESRNRAGERYFKGLAADTLADYVSLSHPDKKIHLPRAPYYTILDTLTSTPIHPVIKFRGWLQVTYALKAEPLAYQRLKEIPQNRYGIVLQHSFIRMLVPSLLLEPSGQFDLQGLFVEGYWTWELMAESLPIDYDPDV